MAESSAAALAAAVTATPAETAVTLHIQNTHDKSTFQLIGEPEASVHAIKHQIREMRGVGDETQVDLELRSGNEEWDDSKHVASYLAKGQKSVQCELTVHLNSSPPTCTVVCHPLHKPEITSYFTAVLEGGCRYRAAPDMFMEVQVNGNPCKGMHQTEVDLHSQTVRLNFHPKELLGPGDVVVVTLRKDLFFFHRQQEKRLAEFHPPQRTTFTIPSSDPVWLRVHWLDALRQKTPRKDAQISFARCTRDLFGELKEALCLAGGCQEMGVQATIYSVRHGIMLLTSEQVHQLQDGDQLNVDPRFPKGF
jgi:hypothetical protein